MKKSLVLILTSITIITIILVVLGFMYDQPEDEKQQGLTDVFDVSSDGTIAYVVYDKGQAGIYLKKENEIFGNPVLQFGTEKAIQDIDFSPDGSMIAYVVSNKDVQSSLESTVYLTAIESFEERQLFMEQALITEIDFDPKDQDVLFYLRAGTFENYSPIASAHPHEFDVHSYRIADNEHEKHTAMSKYSMRSLQVSSTDDSVFLQMDDDAHVETAEDIFATAQRIFKIPLDSVEGIEVVSNLNRNEPIYDFVIVPNKAEVIFQSVSKTNEKGIYEYELFLYNWENDKEKQLTYLKESANRPVIDPRNGKVFFVVDNQFGKRYTDYHLYQMDLDGENVKEVPLDLGMN